MTREEAERLLLLAREAQLVGPEATSWIERLGPKRQEIVEAVGWLAGNEEEEAAVELAAGVWRLWLTVGDVAGGRQMLAAALDLDHPKLSHARALALYADGVLAFREGAQAASRARNDEALNEARALGDTQAEALALVGLSRVAFRDGDNARVRSLAGKARELSHRLGDAAEAAPLHMLAAGTRLGGDYDAAIALYTESLELSRRLKDSRGVSMELHNIGHVQLHRGNVDDARRCFAACAEFRDEDDPYGAAMTHLNRAALAFATGDRGAAAELVRQTQATLDAVGIVLDPDDAFEVKWLQGQLATAVS